MSSFENISAGIHVWRYPVLDVNVSLVVGRAKALLIDTLACASQGLVLAHAVAELTPLPVTILNTHIHFDHTFGNAEVSKHLPVDGIWAHHSVAETMRRRPDALRASSARECRELVPELATEVADTALLAPTNSITDQHIFDLGDCFVEVWHPGPAHTHGDLIAKCHDVMFAGDLVEESGPVDVGPESDLDNWPQVLDSLLPFMTGPVVPGHGAIVDAQFVWRQKDLLASRSSWTG